MLLAVLWSFSQTIRWNTKNPKHVKKLALDKKTRAYTLAWIIRNICNGKICVFVQAWCDDEGERYCCRKCHASKYKQSILNSQRRTRNSLNSGSLKTRVNIMKTNKSIAVKVRISFPSRRLLLKICCTYAGIVNVRRPSYLDSLAQRKRRKIMEREHGSKRTKNSFSRR